MADFSKYRYTAHNMKPTRPFMPEWEALGSIALPSGGTIGTNGTALGTTDFFFDSAHELMFVPRGTQAAGGAPDLLLLLFNMPDGTNPLTNEQASYAIPTVSAEGFAGPSNVLTSGFGEKLQFGLINNTATSILSDTFVDVYAR